MAEQVAPSDDPFFTERWTIPFYKVPTVRGSVSGLSSKAYDPLTYGRILDTLYEMADEVATSNGVAIELAIRTVISTEGWQILPLDIALLAKIYKFDEDKPIRIDAMLNKKHSYSIGTQRGTKKFNIEVVAANRRAAARIALQNGFKVNDVNMTG